jgi:hypothetical protein
MNDLTANPNLEWTLRWSYGAVTVQALGGMLAPVAFTLPGGKSISPMQVARWGDDNDPAWPGILRRLRGEWPCVPFGASQPPAGLPAGWSGHAAEDAWDHGFSANHDWHLVSQTEDELVIAIDYPRSSAVQRLERSIRPSLNSASITVELRVHARRRAQMPLALHPTFAIPHSGVELVAKARRIHSYPVPTEPGVSRLLPNSSGSALDAMPTTDGGSMSFQHLPLPFATEELMQLQSATSPVLLRYLEEKVDVQLDWDTSVLPDAMLWVSNGGRSQAPWSSRHYALGVEPLSGFFDLGRVVQPGPEHPLAASKGVWLDPQQALKVSYTLAAIASV